MIDLPAELSRRRDLSLGILDGLRSSIWTTELDDFSEKCCVYATGSLARYELDERSDLDLFVVDHFDPHDEGSALNFVEQSRLVAALDGVRSELIFADRPFSRGGEFLRPLPFSSMVAEIGDPSDDGRNLFTARMLLLINSTPLVNDDAYKLLWSQALDPYWSGIDSNGNAYAVAPEDGYRPIMLINDLRRWWLTVALNFERFNRHELVSRRVQERAETGASDLPGDPVVERRIANLKLRYSRMLAVYSVFVGLLAKSGGAGAIRRSDMELVLRAEPVGRLISAAETVPSLETDIEWVLLQYAAYLSFMRGTKAELASRVAADETYKPLKQSAYDFHDRFFKILTEVGDGDLLYKYMVI